MVLIMSPLSGWMPAAKKPPQEKRATKATPGAYLGFGIDTGARPAGACRHQPRSLRPAHAINAQIMA
jgi:hypothetical protein